MRVADSHPLLVALCATLSASHGAYKPNTDQKISLKDGNNQSRSIKIIWFALQLEYRNFKTPRRPVLQIRKRTDRIDVGQEKQSSVLTVMEKYMCLPDIYKVYSACFFFSLNHPNKNRNQRGFQLPGFSPAVYNWIQNKSVGCGAAIPEISLQIFTQTSQALPQSTQII